MSNQRKAECGFSRFSAGPTVSASAGVLVLALLVAAGFSAAQAAPSLPEIRTSGANAVPRCVTPERLMSFLKRRNGSLNPRFRDIATFYKRHGEAWNVRWDYAFFQMAIETNFLTYRAPSGRMGDVDPKQNNFAGIGTTGGGVPGDSFPDVSTGVLGQIQHLVVYSGEEIANPVAPRTQLKQVHILEKSRELHRPVRFSDLARRWAADPKYGSSIAWVADQFAREECKGREEAQVREVGAQEAEVLPWQRPEVRAPVAKAGALADSKAATDTKDKAPVRTIWRRDGAKQAAPNKAPAAKAEAKAAAKPAGEAAPKLRPASPKPVQTEVILSATAEEAPREDASGEDAPFALFKPPAALADAAMARPHPKAAAVPPVKAASPDKGASPARPEWHAPLAVWHAPLKVPDAKVAMGPPPPPAGVSAAELAETDQGEAEAQVQVQAQARSDDSNFAPPSGLGVKPGRCVVETATFGGATTVLVKAPVGADVHYIALSVIDGFEAPMTESFLAARQGGGEAIGTYPSKDEALAKARSLCPEE